MSEIDDLRATHSSLFPFRRPRLLDLFCGAGGASRGYHDAGFEVVGVDHAPQPNYPYEFHRGDALEILNAWRHARLLDGFDAIHASPPCQRDTSMQAVAQNAAAHPDLIDPTRDLLQRAGLPYVIENVAGARTKLRDPFLLCGSMFGLGVWKSRPMEFRQLRRHRYFETNWDVVLLPQCAHEGKTVGIYGDHLRWGRRSADGELSGPRALGLGSLAMGIDPGWMTWDELKEAIPPAMTGWIGERLATHVLAINIQRVTAAAS